MNSRARRPSLRNPGLNARTEMKLLLQLLANGLVNGSLFALLACAFGLVYRSARVFHIAFAGLFLVAPYVMFLAIMRFGVPIWLGVVMGVAAAAAAGYLLELLLYRPFFRRKCSAGAVLVASLGTLIIIENALALAFGNDVRTIGRDLAFRITLGPIALSSIQVAQIGISTAMLVLLGLAIHQIPTFKAIWAMGDEPELIPALGLPLMRYRSLVFGLSAAVGGIAGCLLTLDVGVDPHMGMSYLLIAAVGMLAGGIDRYAGWVLGGLSLALLESVIAWKFSARWMDLATFSLLIFVLLFRPQGVLGLRKRLEEA